MEFIQPTLSFKNFLKSFFVTAGERTIKAHFQKNFPDYNAVLTDSGRSAFAALVETLCLPGKKVAFPAFLCDVFAPVITKYGLQPIFLDIDEQTFLPPLAEYQAKAGFAEAIVVCHTFGKAPTAEAENYLKNSQKIIIRDVSHCPQSISSPLFSQSNHADAFFVSLPKILPLPDGGIAFLRRTYPSSPKPLEVKSRLRLQTLKRFVQLFSGGRWLIWQLKAGLQVSNLANDPFTQVSSLSSFSKKLLALFLKKPSTLRPFCIPLLVPTEERESLEKKLREYSIYPERLWESPLVQHKDISSFVHEKFPTTKRVASHIICLPRVSDPTLKNLPKDVRAYFGQ